MWQLSTVGYEGASLGDFLALLRHEGVEYLIDVRALPLSRRRGFSKSSLATHLKNEGIQYMHLGSLGDPRPGREAARAGRYLEFRRIYLTHLATESAQRALRLLASISAESSACLLCFERDAATCHRSLIADALASSHGTHVKHLVIGSIKDGKSERPLGRTGRTGPGARQGRSAA